MQRINETTIASELDGHNQLEKNYRVQYNRIIFVRQFEFIVYVDTTSGHTPKLLKNYGHFYENKQA